MTIDSAIRKLTDTQNKIIQGGVDVSGTWIHYSYTGDFTSRALTFAGNEVKEFKREIDLGFRPKLVFILNHNVDSNVTIITSSATEKVFNRYTYVDATTGQYFNVLRLVVADVDKKAALTHRYTSSNLDRNFYFEINEEDKLVIGAILKNTSSSTNTMSNFSLNYNVDSIIYHLLILK